MDVNFSRSLTSFRNRLTKQELEVIQDTKLADVEELIKRMQTELRARKEAPNFNRIKKFIAAVEQFEEVITVYVNASEYVAFIWGPMKLLLQIGVRWRDAFEDLLDAYEQLGDHMPFLKQYEASFGQCPYMRYALELIYDDIKRFHEHAVRFFADKAWKQLFKAFWKNFKPKFDHILSCFIRHGEMLRTQASLSQHQQYQRDHEDSLRRFELQEEAELDRKLAVLKQWLQSENSTVEFEAAQAARLTSIASGEWLLSEPKILDWKDADVPSCPVLWMNGIPGAGKSVLASLVIQECQRKDYLTSYFYCIQDDPQKNTAVAIIRGLLSHLLPQSRGIIPYVYDKYGSTGETILSSLHLAKQLLDIFCERIEGLYLIIDGLDECEHKERRQLLDVVAALVENHEANDPGKLRLLVVSQNEADIRRRTNEMASADMLMLEASHSAKDIRAYVSKALQAVQSKFDLTQKQTQWVVDKTCLNANGMFLFARLVVENLAALPTKEQLQLELQGEFPSGLNDAYNKILKRIRRQTVKHEPLWKAIFHLLSWLISAQRPLRWYEIQAAVSIDTEIQDFFYDERKFQTDVLDACGSLVKELCGKRLALVHSTAKHYIAQNENIEFRSVQRRLSALCLQYLTFDSFSQNIDEEGLRQLIEKGHLVFQDYAVANWIYHIKELFDEECSDASATLELHQYQDINTAVEEFTETYEEDLLMTSARGIQPEAAAPHIEALFVPDAQILRTHVDCHLNSNVDVRNTISLKKLAMAVNRNRKLLEDICRPADATSVNGLAFGELYGLKRFKCTKVTCFWFHEGFEDAKARARHISIHDRPYRCTEIDCSVEDFGFKTAKELEKHTRTYHPTIDEHSEVFAIPKAAPEKTPFACPHCPKRFTRNFHLKSHIHNHNSEKPFACSECGREFTRSNDCKRHEKNIHGRVKQ